MLIQFSSSIRIIEENNYCKQINPMFVCIVTYPESVFANDENQNQATKKYLAWDL